MAKTAAERQAVYRAKRPFAGADSNGERRLNLWVNTGTALALKRLAKRYGVTQREMLERLVTATNEEVLRTLAEGKEWDDYFDVTA